MGSAARQAQRPVERSAQLPCAQDVTVWVAAARRGIQAHRHVPGELTPCRRNPALGGTTATAVDAAARWRVEWSCRTCWPPATPTSALAGVP